MSVPSQDNYRRQSIEALRKLYQDSKKSSSFESGLQKSTDEKIKNQEKEHILHKGQLVSLMYKIVRFFLITYSCLAGLSVIVIFVACVGNTFFFKNFRVYEPLSFLGNTLFPALLSLITAILFSVKSKEK